MEDLVLPVPQTLPALYLVPCLSPNGSLLRLARDAVAVRVAEPLRSLTMRLLGSPVLRMEVRTAQSLTVLPPTACDPAVDGKHVEAVTQAGEFVAFGAVLPPLPGPLHEWTTRSCAAALAAELDLPVIDGFARTIATAEGLLGTLPGAASLAEAEGGFCLSDWIAIQIVDDGLVTSGMGRFGLPELRVTDVAPDHYLAWGFALAGLGQRLHSLLRCELRRDPAAAFFEVPAEPLVTAADMSRAQGIPFRSDAGLRVRLALDPAVGETLDAYLTVQAPEDWAGTQAEHRSALRDVLVADVRAYVQACLPS